MRKVIYDAALNDQLGYEKQHDAAKAFLEKLQDAWKT
jgi:hypothetical protein